MDTQVTSYITHNRTFSNCAIGTRIALMLLVISEMVALAVRRLKWQVSTVGERTEVFELASGERGSAIEFAR